MRKSSFFCHTLPVPISGRDSTANGANSNRSMANGGNSKNPGGIFLGLEYYYLQCSITGKYNCRAGHRQQYPGVYMHVRSTCKGATTGLQACDLFLGGFRASFSFLAWFHSWHAAPLLLCHPCVLALGLSSLLCARLHPARAVGAALSQPRT